MPQLKLEIVDLDNKKNSNTAIYKRHNQRQKWKRLHASSNQKTGQTFILILDKIDFKINIMREWEGNVMIKSSVH